MGAIPQAVRELYNGCRQVVFYLGAFDEYKTALLVIADASKDQAFRRAVDETLNSELKKRLGPATGIYLVAPSIMQ